ncbi:MAG TPA: MBOAT family protein [Clostridiaceae bacterium]|nr:MBOAT family protein [Clostridiaceae bacterium]
MVFSSLIFLYAFLPLCLILVWLSPSIKAQNAILLVFSLFFYAWGEPVYVILLIIVTLFIWWCGLMMEKTKGKENKRVWLILALEASLASLIAFKYTGFIVEIINVIPGLNIKAPQISLPIGISFYTFQALTYIIDLYRGEIKVQRSYAKFILYVSLFPQLIAGPIVRYSDVESMLGRRSITAEGVASGIGRFLVGLSKKVLIANYAGEIVSYCLESDHFSQISSATAILGIIAFGIQIYFDFSGYSDMAIGLGKMFGFYFLENFNYPYIATTVTEFWRRWHMSLSTFFRDYVYIPLGGNKKHRLRNTFIVWFLTGLWHGANINFVLWGLYYFVLLTFERWLILPRINRIPRIVGLLMTHFATLFGWGLFYFTDLGRFGVFLGRVFAPGLTGFIDFEGSILWKQHIVFLIIAAIASTPILQSFKLRYKRQLMSLEQTSGGGILQIAGMTVLLLSCTASLVASSYNPFLYFRF